MKFERPAGNVQAYLYREAGLYRATVYVLAGAARSREPVHTLSDPDEEALLTEVRAWVEAHYPRPR